MSAKRDVATDPQAPQLYQIRLRDHLSDQWADWLGGLTVELTDGGETLLTGPVADQAALHGLFKKIRDLGIPLISVIGVAPGQTDHLFEPHKE